MNSQQLVTATHLYNDRLRALHTSKGLPEPIVKKPQALLEELVKTEATILKRIGSGDYKCKYCSFSSNFKEWSTYLSCCD